MKKILLFAAIVLTAWPAVLPAPAQTYTFSIFAGQTNAIGTNDGSGAAALFNHPRGLAMDPTGNVYVADTYNSSIRQITPGGDVTTMSFKTVPLAIPLDQPGLFPEPPSDGYYPFNFIAPQSILVDANANLYVSDANIIYRTQRDPADPGALVVAAFAGVVEGPVFLETNGPVDLHFSQPSEMALDTSSNLYVADEYNQVVCQITPSGVVNILAGTLGVAGNNNGAGTNAGFTLPYGIAVGQSNTIYVTDNFYYLREITQTNVVSDFWYPDSYTTPYAIATDGSGNVYVVGGIEGTNYMLQITPGGVSSVLGILPTSGLISGIAVDCDRNIYLADQQNSVIIKATPSYPQFFNGQSSLTSGIYYLAFTNGTPFGYYNLGSFNFPVFYHYDLGFEIFYDANDGQGGTYFYDFSSGSFWFTSPQVFPYLYDFTLNTWLYYYPNTTQPGHYTTNPRYFYDFSSGQIITK